MNRFLPQILIVAGMLMVIAAVVIGQAPKAVVALPPAAPASEPWRVVVQSGGDPPVRVLRLCKVSSIEQMAVQTRVYFYCSGDETGFALYSKDGALLKIGAKFEVEMIMREIR